MPDRLKGADLKAPKDLLSAILLADSFNQRFRPMTVEKPKVLLPLVNVPLINYTLEWLIASGVDEILVFCCAHAAQVRAHLEAGPWLKNDTHCKVQVVTITTCSSAGEALRTIDQKHLIKNDFVLVTGDTVANMDLAAAVKAHRDRREADKTAILTMVMRQAGSPLHRARLAKDAVAVVINPATGQLLKYEDLGAENASAKSRRRQGTVAVDSHLFADFDVLSVRTDLLDCQVYIAALEVLLLFSDNFDYQNVRREFVTGVLSEEELGNKIFVHELSASEYAERAGTFRAYDAVSRDVMNRWTFPFVPDTNLLPVAGTAQTSSYSFARGNIYLEADIDLSRSASVQRNSCIGAGTAVQDDAVVAASVIGRRCEIGRGAIIRDSYLGDDVIVHDGATVEGAMVAEGVVIHKGAHLHPGSIVSYKCVIGKGHDVLAEQHISLCHQIDASHSLSDDDTEMPSPGMSPSDSEWPEGTSQQPSVDDVRTAQALAFQRTVIGGTEFDEIVVGRLGAGFRWNPPADHLRFSTALPDYEAVAAAAQMADYVSSDDDSAATVADLDPMEASDVSQSTFRREVSETLLRCKQDGFHQNNAVIELNALKIAEDRTFADCARFILVTILGLCLPPSERVRPEYRNLFPTARPDNASKSGRMALLEAFRVQLTEWSLVLRRFLKDNDDQVDAILTLEEFCGEDDEFTDDSGGIFANSFPSVLKELYDQDVLVEEALLAWADEKASAGEEDVVFLEKAKPFITWLRTAESSEEESD